MLIALVMLLLLFLPRCLQAMIDGCGREFNSYIDQELLELIFQALTHTNRFVRETGYYVLGSLVNCNANQGMGHTVQFCLEI